jgi:hypothetical protein
MTLTPCADCPWRKDAPRRLWDRQHFLDVWRECQDDGTHVMLCHQAAKLPDGPRKNDLFCRGWALVLGFAAIGMRLLAMRGVVKPSDLRPRKGGPALFKTFAAMLRAQGIRPPERNRVRPC